MAYLAIAYPNLKESDYAWIQKVRQDHDKQFSLVEPHITLVFGTDKLSQSEFTSHVQKSLAAVKSFAIKLDESRVGEDISKNLYHAFLVPSVGFNEINEMHDLLYRGALASALRPEISFIPHLTVGSGSKEEITALVDHINTQSISLEATLDTVSIVEFDGTAVENVMTLSLL